MAKKYYSTLTKIGLNAIARATTLNEKVKFSKFCLGDGEINPDVNTSSLTHQVFEGNISSITVDENNENWIVLTCIISAAIGGFTIREVGIKDEDGNLLAVASYPETYKPVLAEGAGKDLIVRVILEVSNTECVELKVDPTVSLATRSDLEAIEKKKADKEDVKKLEKKVETVEQKVTEGVENLDVSEKQIKFVDLQERTLPDTKDTLKTIVAKVVKYLKDLKTVAFTGSYSDLTGVPTTFTPSAHNHDDRYLGLRAKATDSDKLDGHDSTYFAPATHNHDDRYLGKLAKAESARRADSATTAEQVQGFKFRNQNGKLEVLVEGKWIGVGGRQYTEIKKGDRYSGGPGIIRGIFVNLLYLHEIEIDGKKVSMTYHESSPETWSRHASSFNNIEFKNSFVLTFRGDGYSGIKEGYALYQTEK